MMFIFKFPVNMVIKIKLLEAIFLKANFFHGNVKESYEIFFLILIFNIKVS